MYWEVRGKMVWRRRSKHVRVCMYSIITTTRRRRRQRRRNRVANLFARVGSEWWINTSHLKFKFKAMQDSSTMYHNDKHVLASISIYHSRIARFASLWARLSVFFFLALFMIICVTANGLVRFVLWRVNDVCRWKHHNWNQVRMSVLWLRGWCTFIRCEARLSEVCGMVWYLI